MIITRAPFRIPLGGGGTDLQSYYKKFGCSLISVAIDKYMLVTVSRPFMDQLIRLKYSKIEIVDKISQIQHDLVREALRLTKITHSIEISSVADIPGSTGMGSSGAYLVALLKALHTLKNEQVTKQQLAEEACRIEIELLKLPFGKQDQYMAAFGGLTQLLIDKKGVVEVKKPKITHKSLQALEDSLLIFYTGIKRASEQVLIKQDQATKIGDKAVINSLHSIKEIGQEITKALEKGNIRKVGQLMDIHWQHKRKLSGRITNDTIDSWYQLGKDNGALGGKLMGAGGGGFLLFCCLSGKQKLRQAMSKEGLKELSFKFDLQGVKVLKD